jgi:putative oxidoreductase
MENDMSDGVILAARLLAPLFFDFRLEKLTDYSGTVSRMVRDGARFPVPATFISIFTRLSAVLLALYTLGTALIAHRYWTVTGPNKVDSLESFYKNLSIMGGFLLTGAGKYSIDAILGL